MTTMKLFDWGGINIVAEDVAEARRVLLDDYTRGEIATFPIVQIRSGHIELADNADCENITRVPVAKIGEHFPKPCIIREF